MSSNQVEIRVGGKRYGGWKSVLISRAVEVGNDGDGVEPGGEAAQEPGFG